jgi:hypothetical protein
LTQEIVVLIGSPKSDGGTSASFGDYLLGKISNKITKKSYHVGKALRNEESWNKLTQAIDNADSVILVFPLYWDHLPSHLITTLERLHLHRMKNPNKKVQNLYVAVQNGFPEPWHNEMAIKVCEVFAKEAGLDYKGALNIGGGAAINGRPLEETGGMTHKLRQTLDMAAEAIGKGEPIPKEVEKRLAKPLYPPGFAVVFGGIGWKRQAKKKGAKTSLRARPYKK